MASAELSARPVDKPVFRELEQLPPEGGCAGILHMAQVNGSHAHNDNSNPVTSHTKVLIGVPRKQGPNIPHSNGYHDNGLDDVPDDVQTIGEQQNVQLVANGNSSPSSSSSSESESSDGVSSDSEEGEGEVSEEEVLKRAGVQLDLETLGTPAQAGGTAPIELLSEFVSCCVREEYEAALILCNKVLAFEPSNSTAQQFLPVLQERLKLDEELSTESEDTSDDETSDSEDSATCNKTSHDLCST